MLLPKTIKLANLKPKTNWKGNPKPIKPKDAVRIKGVREVPRLNEEWVMVVRLLEDEEAAEVNNNSARGFNTFPLSKLKRLPAPSMKALIQERQAHPMLGSEIQQPTKRGDTGGCGSCYGNESKGDVLPAVTAVVYLAMPNTAVWVAKRISVDGWHAVGYGIGRVLPPGKKDKAGCWGRYAQATPTMILRDLHYRLAVSGLSEWLDPLAWFAGLAGFDLPDTYRTVHGKDQPESAGGGIFVWLFPIVAPVLLAWSMVWDTIAVTLLGAIGVLECFYLAARYGIASPGQLEHAAIRRHYDQRRGGHDSSCCGVCSTTKDRDADAEALLPFDGLGNCELPVHLLVPRVNSHTLAASLAVSALVVFIEVKNLVVEAPDDATRRQCYIALGVQYAFNCVVQTVAMSLADFADEAAVAALQTTGALPEASGKPRADHRHRDIAAALAPSAPLKLAGGRFNLGNALFGGVMFGVLWPGYAGFPLAGLVWLRGRSGYLYELGAGGLGPIGGGLAGFVFLVNLALFDTIRWLSTGTGIFFDTLMGFDLLLIIGAPAFLLVVTLFLGSVTQA